MDISAAFDTIDTDKLLLRLESDFGVRGLASAWIRSYLTGRSCYVAKSGISGLMSGAAILAFLRECVLGPVLFSAFVSPISRIMESYGIRLSSIRGRHPTLHGGPLPGCVSIGGSLTVCLGVDVLVPRQRASIELNQVRGHDPRFKAGPFQAGARRLVGHWRWSRGGQGRNQNPRCSPRSNLVNERPSEVVDKDLQLPHPFSPTCSSRSECSNHAKFMYLGLVSPFSTL